MTFSRYVCATLCFTGLVSASLSGDPQDDSSSPPQRSELIGDEVLLPLDANASRPTIHAKINGKGPYEFILDTGADAFVMYSDLAQELALPVVGKSAMGDPDNPLAIKTDLVRIESVQLGGIRLSGVTASSWDPPESMRGHLKGRGVFGLSMLAEFLVTFDYDAGKIRIAHGALPSPNGEDVLEWRGGDDTLPTLKLAVGELSLDAHIDSGSPGRVMLPDHARQKLTFKSEPVVIGHGRTVNSEFTIRRGTLDGQVKLGSYVFENPDVAFATMLDSSGYANIGSGMLRTFKITFDQKNGRIRFERSASTNGEGLHSRTNEHHGTHGSD